MDLVHVLIGSRPLVAKIVHIVYQIVIY